MRFVCDVCQTRYIIPDERARGRVLKVRCKKCSNVIILRPDGDAAAELEPPTIVAASPASRVPVAVPSPASRSPAPSPASRVSRQPARASPTAASATMPDHGGGEEATQMVDTDALQRLRDQSARAPARVPSGPELGKREAEPADWHVILAGKQLGPLAMSALIEKMLSGEMSARSFVWRDGQGDWKRAEEVADVARWLPAQPSPTPPPQKIPQAGQKPAGAKAPEKAKDKPKEKAEAAKPKSKAAALKAPGKSPASRRNLPEDSAEVDQFFSGADLSDQVPAKPSTVIDPFSQVSDAPGLEAPKPGEVTRFFITQAGVEKHRSPWRIAAYAGGGAVFVVLVVVALSQLGVDVPLVSSSDGSGHHIFSGRSKDRKLKDELLGKPKEEPTTTASASRSIPSVHPSGSAGPAPIDPGPLAKKAEQHIDQLGKSDKDQLAQLYKQQNLSPVKLKPTATASPVIDRPDAPLTPEQVSKTVARFQSGYAACIDSELKRNPGFQGGKIRIVTTIMSSGLVRQAQIQSDDARLARNVSGGALGGCLKDQTRRMVFPSFQGDPFDAEIPLVLGASM